MVWPDGAQYGGMWNNGLLVETFDVDEVPQVKKITIQKKSKYLLFMKRKEAIGIIHFSGYLGTARY